MKQSNKNLEGSQVVKFMVIVSKHITNWERDIVHFSLPPGILLNYTVVTLHYLKGKE